MMTTVNSDNEKLIEGTAEGDSIKNSGNYVTISAGEGNDTISNTGDKVFMDGGKGDDFFDLVASSVTAKYPDPTVTAGEGKDTIKITTNTSYNNYGGYYYGTTNFNVTVTDLSTDDTIYLANQITGFDAYIENGNLKIANNDIATPGLMSLTLPSVTTAEKYNSLKTISVVNGNSETNFGELIKTNLSFTDNATLTGTADNDTIRIDAKNNSVDAMAGSDLIIVDKIGTASTILGGEGSDIIYLYADDVILDAGNGDDLISLSAEKNGNLNGGAGADEFFIDTATKNVTITGGEGSDTINFVYSASDSVSQAAVAITDLGSDDVLKFGKAINSISANYVSGNLVLTDDQAYASITLLGTGSTENISNVVVESGGTSTTLEKLLINSINVKTQQKVIKDFVSALDNSSLSGNQAIDAAIVSASDGRFTSYENLLNVFVTECKNSTDKNAFLKNYCGIDLTNSDVGAITGYDAGGSSTQLTGESIIPEDTSKFVKLDAILTAATSADLAALNNLDGVKFDDQKGNLSFTKNGLTLNISGFQSYVTDLSSDDTAKVADAQNRITVINGLYTWWIENSLNLINDSFGINFQEADTTVKEMDLNFYEDTDTSAAYAYVSQNTTDNQAFDLNVNLSKVNNLDLEKNPSGAISSYYLDRLVAQGLTQAVLRANLKDFNNNTYYTWAVISEGLGELTQGADDTKKDALLLLMTSMDKEVTSDITSTVLTNTTPKDSDTSYLQSMFSTVSEVENVFGYALLRYFAKQVADSSIFPYGVRYSGDKTSVIATSLFSGDVLNVGENDATVQTVDASNVKKAVAVHGNESANVITALPSGGSIYGEGGADTLYAGEGVDYFFYGNEDGNDIIYDFSANDFLHVTAGNIESIFADSNGDVNLKIAENTVILKDAAGKEISITDYTGNTTKKSYTFGNSNDTTSGGNDTTSGGNDTTSGGNDTTSGGNDTTSGGSETVAPNSTLVSADGFYTYDGGNKVIVNYTQGEKIKYLTDFTGLGIGNNEFSVKSSSGGLQIANAAGKVVEVTDANGGNSIYAYMAVGAETIDGSAFSNYEVIMGSPNNSNYFSAGSGGSSLWGGGGSGSNTLVGGAGNDCFVYSGGNDVVKDYQTGDLIEYLVPITGYDLSDDTFSIISETGSMTIRDARDKLITVLDSSGNTNFYAFRASGGGILDGRSISGTEVIIGADNLSNDIYVGNGGGTLWGGNGNVPDTLNGGNGVDVFWSGRYDGNDYITNASQNDFVNLYDIGLSSVIDVGIANNLLSANFTTGRNLNVSYTDAMTPTFLLSDNSKWQYSNSTSSWSALG